MSEISKEKEVELKEKTKRISIKEGCAYAVSEGFGMRYITPYALQLKATNAHIGFLSSLPSLLGNFSQLFTPKIMEKVPRKKIAFYGALLQAIMWIPIILIGLTFFVFKINSFVIPTILVLIYTLLIMFGAFYKPAWDSLMKEIVTENSGKYFGHRNRIVGFTLIVSMLIASLILDFFKHKNLSLFFGFLILFSIAFIARTISAFLFLKKYEPKIQYDKQYYFTFFQFVKYIPKSNFGKFALFVALIQFATAIASPFFAVYMLKDLKFSYLDWVIVSFSSSLASILFMPFWGKFIDHYGNIKTAKITSLLIPFVPWLWVLSIFIPNKTYLIVYLFFVEIFSGIVWAGFNLSSGNFVYDAVTKQRMGLCVAYSNLLQGIGVFIGATLGGFLASHSFSFLGLSPLLVLFIISGILRMTVALIMIPKIKEVRDVKKFGIKEAIEKLSTLTPDNLWRLLEINIRPRKAF